MSKHAPGPWALSKESPKIIMSGSGIDGNDGYMIGSVTGTDNSGFYASEEEAEANARLMAAAPKLLHALVRIANMADALSVCCHENVFKKQFLDMFPGIAGAASDIAIYARAAITEAVGEQP